MPDDDRLDDMTAAVLRQNDPWTESQFFALVRTGTRAELFDGSLLLGPAPSIWHIEASDVELVCEITSTNVATGSSRCTTTRRPGSRDT